MVESILLACSVPALSESISVGLRSRLCVQPFLSGTELIEYLTTYPNQDTIVIIDDRLPDITLAECSRQIRHLSPMLYQIGIMDGQDSVGIIDAVKAGICRVVSRDNAECDILVATDHGIDHLTLISHLQRQLEIVSDTSLLRRLTAFRTLLDARRQSMATLLPSEIRLFFPETDATALPIDALIELVESNTLAAAATVISHRPTCLIVEDEPLLNQILTKILSREFAVTSVTSAEAAIMTIEGGARFDLALLDIGLPDVSGDQLVKDLKDICPKMSLIMVTGMTAPDLIATCLTAGAHVILKST
ncbi:response regulator [bacterium]|nr:response regulator [bacterium]